MKMRKLFSGFYALIFLSSMYMFKMFSPISDQHQYVKRHSNLYFTNEILPHKHQSYAVSYSRTRYLKYQEKFPNVPLQFLYEMKSSDGQHCIQIEEKENSIYNERNINKLFNITINNQYWQEYISKSGLFYLYNAYLDTRGEDSLIQIIAIAEETARHDVNKCALWYNNSADPDISVEPMEMNSIGRNQRLFIGFQNSIPDFNNMLVYVLTCKIPNKGIRIPQAVSIFDNMDTNIYKKSNCYENSNYLKVNFDYEEKKDFAVCVKGYFYQKSHSIKLIEWIELLSILGAKKIFLYALDGNTDVWKVFDFYTKKGILDVRKCTIPGDVNFRNSSYLKMHLHHYRYDAPTFLNDCLYRNIHKYKFIANTDIDEVIVPREFGHTWSDMMTSISNMHKNATSYFFPTAYFFDEKPEHKPLMNESMYDIPKTSHMLCHVYRSKNIRTKGKSFLNTEFVKKVGSHRADDCAASYACKGVKINSTIGLVHHYRKGCQDDVANICYERFQKDIILDKKLWEFKDELASRSKEILSKLDIEVN